MALLRDVWNSIEIPQTEAKQFHPMKVVPKTYDLQTFSYHIPLDVTFSARFSVRGSLPGPLPPPHSPLSPPPGSFFAQQHPRPKGRST